MADFGKLARQARAAMDNEKGEQVSDGILDKAAAAASKVTGGKHDEKIAKAREKADGYLGQDDAGRGENGRGAGERDGRA